MTKLGARLAIAAVWVIFVSTYSSTDAYPLRSGTCRAGPSIGTSSGGTHGSDGVGSLEANSFVVEMDGTVVTPDEVVTVAPETKISVTVKALEGAFFRGYLNRVGGNDGVDAAGTLTVVDAENSTALASTGDAIGSLVACAEDVAGITHSNARDKTELTVNFTPSANVGDSYTMDIQLVMANGQAFRDDWVYSGYKLVVVDAGEEAVEETEAPAAAPAEGESEPRQKECNDVRYCRLCNRCRRKFANCVQGAPYCAFCQEFCPETYVGPRVPPETTNATCPNLRFGRFCFRCRKFEKCEGAGTAFCTFCQDVFPEIYKQHGGGGE